MKRLKCIGGHADGKILEVDSRILDGDIVRVPRYRPIPFKIDDPDPIGGQIDYEFYVVHALHFAPATPLRPHGDVGEPRRWTGEISTLEYLAPVDWTQERAIRHQFEKVGPVKYHVDPMEKFKVNPPDMRKLRVYRLAHQIMHIIAKYFDRQDDSYQHALEDLTDAFYDVGAEIVTDDDRANAKLPPRTVDGWTREELLAIEEARLQAMRATMLSPTTQRPV